MPEAPGDSDPAADRVAPTAQDPAGIAALAYAVHTSGLGSTRTASTPAAGLDQRALELFRAALRLTSSLRVQDALRNLVESASALTGAAWGTIGVAGAPSSDLGRDTQVSVGETMASPEELSSQLAASHPGASGTQGVVVDNNLDAVSAFTGAIEGESAGSVLSAPLSVRGTVYGRIYLCDKPGGFDEEDVAVVLTLAEAAAVAVQNAQLYREARDRERWMAVSQELTTLLLSGAEQDDALTLIAQRVRHVAQATTSVLILPSVGTSWVCEIADGEGADELVGTVFPPEGRALTALERQTGLTVPSLAREWERGQMRVAPLARFGPALYAPMVNRGNGVGVILLLRAQGDPEFTAQDLEIAELVAAQATMAFELADAQHAEEMAALLDERARIGRDLHDLAIQQLFATGMQLSAARERVASSAGSHAPEAGAPESDAPEAHGVLEALDASLEAVDESVGQIRSIVRSLRDRDEEVSVVERLRREASLARTALGFAPSLILSVDGRGLARAERGEEDELIRAVDAAVDSDLADDMVAVVREGLSNVARHAHASSAAVEVRISGVLSEATPSGLSQGAVLEPGTGAEDPERPVPASGAVEISCTDDGVGMDPSSTRRSGTANMAERARRHGGSFALGHGDASGDRPAGTSFLWRASI